MSPWSSGSDAVALAVTEASQVGEARRLVADIAVRLGFNETDRGKAALVVTEVANNLVKHARNGQLILRRLADTSAVGLEVLALDQGPGMSDPGRCLRDGFSTAGTPGTGLGAIARLATTTDVYSLPPLGTALLARLWSQGDSASSLSRPAFQTGGVCLPHPGEQVCGDAWALAHRPGRLVLLVADGLGHGPGAAEASGAAVRAFRADPWIGPGQLLHVLHAALRSTRGAAVAVAEIDLDAGEVRFAGVGNIAAAVLDGISSRSLMSHNGTAGYEVYRIQELSCPWPRGGLLVMHSDGLTGRWDLARYPGLAGRDPSLVAGVLYRDFKRGRDDVTVLAARALLPEDVP